MLKDIEFDYTQISAENFGILSQIAQNATEVSIEKLKQLFQKKTSSWAIHHLKTIEKCSIDEFDKAIDDLYAKSANVMVYISNEPTTLQKVLDNFTQYVVSKTYYQVGDRYILGIEIKGAIEKFDLIIDTGENIIKVIINEGTNKFINSKD